MRSGEGVQGGFGDGGVGMAGMSLYLLGDPSHELWLEKANKRINNFFPGLSRSFPEICWKLCLCVSWSPTKKATHKQFRPPPFPATIPYVYWFFLSPEPWLDFEVGWQDPSYNGKQLCC